MLRALGAVVVVWACADAAPAAAQDPARWGVVVVTVADDPADVAPVADRVYAQLSVSGRTLVDDAAFGRSVDGVLSTPPHDAPHAVVVRLSDGSNEVARDIAAGRSAAALEKARAILADVEANLAALGRDESSTENLRNLCLFVVRAHLDAHRRDEAAAQALECVRMSPDFTEPSPHWHPPDVVAAFHAARATLDGPGHATLRLDTAPGDPAHCVVRDAGRPIGPPGTRVAVAPGVHQLQVECLENRPARVHRLIVQPGHDARVVVSASFDEALRTAPAVALVYPDRNAMGMHLAEDVARIGRAATLAHVLVVRDDDGRVFLTHFLVTRDGPARSTPPSRVDRPSNADELRAAVDTVTSGLVPEAGQVDIAPPPDEHHDDAHVVTPPVQAATTGEHPPVAIGVIGGITGVVGLATGWAFYGWLQSAQASFGAAPAADVDNYTKLQGDMQTSLIGVLVSSMTGGLALTIALPWLLPDDAGIPAWAWVSGGLGVAAAAVATAVGVIPSACLRDDPCGRHDQSGALVSLVASLAVPLLTIPIVYALRPHGRAAPTVAVTASLGGLAVSGTW